ncbi:MAG: hypothetical protein HUJ53_08980 [Holdemanella sp.]|nr:hypothetical protein [Holdemanella sp.]
MNDEQKVLYKQLQFAGLGIVLMIAGIFLEEKAMIYVGLGVLIFGVLRFYLLHRFINKIQEDE